MSLWKRLRRLARARGRAARRIAALNAPYRVEDQDFPGCYWDADAYPADTGSE